MRVCVFESLVPVSVCHVSTFLYFSPSTLFCSLFYQFFVTKHLLWPRVDGFSSLLVHLWNWTQLSDDCILSVKLSHDDFCTTAGNIEDGRILGTKNYFYCNRVPWNILCLKCLFDLIRIGVVTLPVRPRATAVPVAVVCIFTDLCYHKNVCDTSCNRCSLQ